MLYASLLRVAENKTGDGKVSILVKDRKFYRTLFPLIAVIALQNVITFVVALADNVMLGMYSETALSGAALVNQIQFLLQMVVGGIGEGMLVMTSRFWGAKDITSIKKTTAVGLLLGIITAAGMWAAVFFLPREVLSLFTFEQTVIGEGTQYMQIVCFSYVFFAVNSILLASLRSVETVKIGFIVSVISLGVNIFLNYMLIFGNFGAPELGARGAAIATLAARIVEVGATCLYVFRIDQKIRLKMRELLRISGTIFRQYIKVGTPVIVSGAMWGVAMAIQAAILGHMGQTAIAANSIAAAVFEVVTVVAYASASAAAVVIAKTLGEDRKEMVKPYTRTLQMIFLMIGAATGIILFFLKDMIVGLYSITPETRQLALEFMTILSVTVVGTAYQMPALTGIVRGGGDTKFVMINDLIFMWGIVLPISAFAAFVWSWSPVLVFICLKSDQILKCFVAVAKVNRYRWIKQLS